MTALRTRTTLVLALVAATVSIGFGGLPRDARAAGTSIAAPDRSVPDGSHENDSGTLAEPEEEVEANDEDGQFERLVGVSSLPVPRLAADSRTGFQGVCERSARLGDGGVQGRPRGPPGRG